MNTDIKARRKALGWSRGELAERAGLDKGVVQLVELGQWEEFEALGRLDTVLRMGEAGEEDPRLAPPEVPEGSGIGG
ncbi:MAG: helix-turn-helix transcriptional regulator [Alphaproteobacteria bacterium]|nr:helix-turn-helix transcriptional regulator [Alphaproteobacteria bacterium]